MSPSSSSSSSLSSDSDLSSSSTPDRKRTGASHSKSNIQRLHRDKVKHNLKFDTDTSMQTLVG